MSLGTASLEIQVRTEDVRRASGDLRRLADAGRDTDNAQKRLERQMANLQKVTRVVSGELARLRDVQRATGGGTKDFNNEVLKMARVLRQAEGQIGNTARQLARLRADGVGAGKGINAAQVSVQKLHGTLGSLRGLIATFSVGALARSIVTLGNDFTRVRQMLLAVSGSTTKAKAEFDYLMGQAYRLGTSFLALADSYAQLNAAAEGTALTGDRLKNVFEAVAETATIMRFSTENTRGVIKAFEQMLSKGTVQAEELRNQLGDRLPGAFGIFVRAYFGVTQATQAQRAEFNALMKQGKIMAEDILPKVAAELRRTFGAGLASSTQSAQAEIGRMEMAWQKLVMTMWDNGLENAVKSLAKTLRSLLESESTQKFAVGFARAIEYIAKTIYEMRGILVPAIAAMTAFVTIFTAGAALRGLLMFTGGAKSAVGIVSALAAAVTGLAVAMGLMNKQSETAERMAGPTRVAPAPGSGSGVNPLSIGRQGSAEDYNQFKRNLYEATQLDEISKSIAETWEGFVKSLQSVGALLNAINLAGMASAGLGVASLVGAARPMMGKVGAKFGEARAGGMGAMMSGVTSVLPQGMRDTVSASYNKNLVSASAGLATFTSNAGLAERQARALATAGDRSLPIWTRTGAAFQGVASGAGKSALALKGLAPAMASVRTIGAGLFAALGGIPGLLIGVTAAIAFMFYDLAKKKKEALTIDSDTQAFIDGLAITNRNKVNPEQGESAKAQVEELNSQVVEITSRLREFKTEGANAMAEVKDQTDALNQQLRQAETSYEALGRTMLGLQVGQLEQAMDGLGDSVSDAIRNKDWAEMNRLLIANKGVIDASNPSLNKAVDAWTDQYSAAQQLEGRIDTNNTLLSEMPGWIEAGSRTMSTLADETGRAANEAARMVGLLPSVAALLGDMRKDAAEIIAFGGATGTQLDLRKIELARQGLDVSNPSTLIGRNSDGSFGISPTAPRQFLDPLDLAGLNETEAMVRQAAATEASAQAARRGGGGGGGRARAAEGRQNRTASDFASAQAKIYGLLDPVKAERIAMEEEVRELTRALTRGGMNAAQATALVAQYRQLREEETAAASRAAARNVDNTYNEAMGLNGRVSQINELENELDNFRVAAMRVGLPLDEINEKIGNMRAEGIRRIERAMDDMSKSVMDARNSVADLNQTLYQLQGLGDNAGEAQTIGRDYATGMRSVADRRKEAVDQYFSSIGSGADPVEVATNYAMVLSSLSQEERVLGQIRDYKINQMEREGRTLATLNSRHQQYLRDSREAQRLTTEANFAGGGRDQRAGAAAVRNREVLEGLFPETDPALLSQIPDLMDSFGSSATDRISTWLERVNRIHDALIEARNAAINTRGPNAVLTDDEINAAALRGAQRAENDGIIRKNQETADAVIATWNTAKDDMEGIMMQAFSGDSAMNSLNDLLLGVVQMVQKMIMEIFRLKIVQPMLDGIFGGMKGGGQGGGFFGGLLKIGSQLGKAWSGGAGTKGFAHGGVFANDNRPLHAFANGVVNSPKYFDMANGSRGLMGESGPEAIVPLKRTKSGDLGVQMTGGGRGGVQVTNNITISIEGSGDANEDIALGAKKARETIEGISAETYLKMEGQKQQQPVSV